jgi:hypothetical protein
MFMAFECLVGQMKSCTAGSAASIAFIGFLSWLLQAKA